MHTYLFRVNGANRKGLGFQAVNPGAVIKIVINHHTARARGHRQQGNQPHKGQCELPEKKNQRQKNKNSGYRHTRGDVSCQEV
jgi:hypothetical protein